MADRIRCTVCANYRIQACGRMYRGKFICSVQCFGAYHMAEWIRWESERMKPKPSPEPIKFRSAK